MSSPTDQNLTGLDWEDVRVFAALARHGSLSAAARALSLSHATVARRIASLEKTLGTRLVERRPEGYVLTPAGNAAVAAANVMEAAAATLQRRGNDSRPTGLVRISATPALAQGFLVSRLASLTAEYEGLDIEVASNVRAASLERRAADIALRYERPQDGDVIATPLIKIGYGFYANSDWKTRLEQGEAPVLVGFDEANADISDAAWLAQQYPRARVAFRTSNQFAQAAAVRGGSGVALLPHFIGQADKELHQCLVHPDAPVHQLWVVTRRDDRRCQPVKTVVDFLYNIFQKEQVLFGDQ
ncbi:LysR family transcriptional regulator [Caballeronia sp. INSB1]|uniref:LysR family transcriptional regulator n=1 Tax=Caballeronia sp. INSB1 TaxID=2921751 RepID=UPI00203229C1|nr:LysR family transcriptional regulator [Caballeronia sp. INSB1]